MLSSFQGALSSRTIVVVRVDPLTFTPIEIVLDLVPGVSGLRFTADVIESESYSATYNVTTDAIQNGGFITSNIHKNPRIMSVTGFLSQQLQINAGVTSVPAVGAVSPPSSGVRFDQIRLANLQAMADSRQVLGIYTPRHAFPKCAITSIDAPWDPNLGKNTRVTISFMELNIVDPLFEAFTPDFNESLLGNNTITGGGQSAAEQSGFDASFPQASGGSF